MHSTGSPMVLQLVSEFEFWSNKSQEHNSQFEFWSNNSQEHISISPASHTAYNHTIF